MSKVSLRQVGMKKVEWKKVGWRQSDNTLDYPDGAVLYFRPQDGLTNQVDGPNPFKSSVLPSQYVRKADGSYEASTDIVDVIGGKKYLRTCGQVVNLFPGDASIARAVSLTAQAYTLQVFGAGSVTCSYGTATVGSPLTFTAIVGSVTFTPTGATLWMLTATAYPQPYTPPGTTMPASHATASLGPWFDMPQFDDAGQTKTNQVWAALDGEPDGVELADVSVNPSISNNSGSVGTYNTTSKTLANTAIGTNSDYPRFAFSIGAKTIGTRYMCRIEFADATNINIVRLASTGATQNLTKNGNVFMGVIVADNTDAVFGITTKGTLLWSTQIVSATIQRIKPSAMTLATKMMMGVGSGDLVAGSAANTISCGSNIVRYRDITGTKYPATSYDGVTPAICLPLAWGRWAIIQQYVQINTAGTQFRAGALIEGIHTTIQWGSWNTYDGSLNPTSAFRLLLGLDNIYPMWFDTIILYRAQIADAKLISDMGA